MCGIVGYVGKKDCTKVLLDSLSKLEYRGYDSAGIAVFENDAIKTKKTKGRLADLEEKLKREGWLNGTCGIGHTRWATHGEPSDINSHPHGNANISIVHNGIIENYRTIKDFLLKRDISLNLRQIQKQLQSFLIIIMMETLWRQYRRFLLR